MCNDIRIPVTRWRGRMGLTKEEQKAAFEAGTLGSDESGFESDEDGPDIEAVGSPRDSMGHVGRTTALLLR